MYIILYNYHICQLYDTKHTLIPDIYVEPSIVFTVEADEITKKKGSKYPSLRFPRLVEWNRDKGITEVSTVRELEGMYGG